MPPALALRWTNPVRSDKATCVCSLTWLKIAIHSSGSGVNTLPRSAGACIRPAGAVFRVAGRIVLACFFGVCASCETIAAST